VICCYCGRDFEDFENLEYDAVSNYCLRILRCAIWGVQFEVCHLRCGNWGVPSEVCQLRCANWGVPTEVSQLRCANWGVPSEVCRLRCNIWGVPSELCHLRCAIWGVPSEVCYLRCAIWVLRSEVCHPRCAFKLYGKVNVVKNTTKTVAKWWCLLARKNYMFRPIAAIFMFWQFSAKRLLYNMLKPRGDVEISSSFCVLMLS